MLIYDDERRTVLSIGDIEWARDRIEQLEKEVAQCKKALELYERERKRYRHAKPELTGEFFLAGGIGDIDDNNLPDYVEIVPAYGCGWSQLYQKTERTISYEGS